MAKFDDTLKGDKKIHNSLSSVKNHLTEYFETEIKNLSESGMSLSFDVCKFEKNKHKLIYVIAFIKPKETSFSDAILQHKLCFYIKVFKANKSVPIDLLKERIVKFISKYKYGESNYKYVAKHLLILCSYNTIAMRVLSKKQYRLIFIIAMVVIIFMATIDTISYVKLQETIRSFFEIQW